MVLAVFTIFQSTHPVRGATGMFEAKPIRRVVISIHAPREGCDSNRLAYSFTRSVISIHAPREGCDSTPGGILPGATYFNPRTP